jgi:hypothetical protein
MNVADIMTRFVVSVPPPAARTTIARTSARHALSGDRIRREGELIAIATHADLVTVSARPAHFARRRGGPGAVPSGNKPAPVPARRRYFRQRSHIANMSVQVCSEAIVS